VLTTLRQRNFVLVWFAGLISLIGDWMLFIALPIYVFILTGSILLTSVIFMVSLAPNLLFGSLAGVFVDRWNRKWTMVVASSLQAVSLLPLLVVNAPDHIWLVYVSAFVESTLGVFFKPAESALLPQLVDDEHLVVANSLSGVNQNLSRLIGPAIGGVVVGLWGVAGVVRLDLISYVIAALLIALVSGVTAHRSSTNIGEESRENVPGSERGVWRELGQGLRIVFRTRVVAVVFLIFAAMSIGEGLFSILLVVWVKRILHGGALELGWLMSGQAVGGLAGGLLIALMGRRVRPARLLGMCSLIFGVLDLVIVNTPLFAGPYLPPSPVPDVTSALVLLVVALFLLVGIVQPGMSTGLMTLLQTNVDNAYLGRIFALVGTVQALMMLGGMALAGFYGDRFGVITLLNGQGGMYICASVVALVFLRRLRAPIHEPSSAAEQVVMEM
jgi:MFS family permease